MKICKIFRQHFNKVNIIEGTKFLRVSSVVIGLTVILSACGSSDASGNAGSTPAIITPGNGGVPDVKEILTESKYFTDCQRNASPQCAGKLYPEILQQMQVEYKYWQQFGPGTPDIAPRQKPTGPVFGTASRFETFVDTIKFFKDTYALELLLPTIAIIAKSSTAESGGGTKLLQSEIAKWYTETDLKLNLAHRSADEDKLGLLSGGWSDPNHKDILYLYYKQDGQAVGLTVERLEDGIYGKEVTKTADKPTNSNNDLPGFIAVAMFPYGFTGMIRELPLEGSDKENYNLMFVAGFETPDESKKFFPELATTPAMYYGALSSNNRFKNQRYHLGQYDSGGYFTKNANLNGELHTKMVVDFSDSNRGPKITGMKFLTYGSTATALLLEGSHFTYKFGDKNNDGTFRNGFPFEVTGIVDSDFIYDSLPVKVKSIYIKGKFYGPKFEGLGAVYTFEHSNSKVAPGSPNSSIFYWGAMGLYRHITK